MTNLKDWLFDEPWQLQAPCGVMDPSIFHDLTTAPQRRRAKAICADCPVRDACLELVLCSPWEPYGVWAGLTQGELVPLWRARHPMTSPTERHQEVNDLIGVVA